MEMKNWEKLARYGLKPMNRLLFYGDSGCGKTFLGKALCNHLGYTMLYVDIARALSQGNVAINITNVFKIANSGGNYMVFLDECDSIAWSRDAKDAEGVAFVALREYLSYSLPKKDYDQLVSTANGYYEAVKDVDGDGKNNL